MLSVDDKVEEINNIVEPKFNLHQVSISVRTLVEFLLRSGDIDNRHGSVASASAMAEGTKAHKRIQNAGGPTYRAEVALKHTVTKSRYEILIDGRADGIFSARIKDFEGITKIAEKNGGEFDFGISEDFRLECIDEIKGMYTDVLALKEPVPVHLAQAKCYAYIYALQENLEYIGVQMSYVDLDTDNIKRFCEIYTFAEISQWFETLMDGYVKWADLEYDHKIMRDASIKNFDFPYPYREGQKKLNQDAYRTILRKKTLFIQAPTGTGKTINALFPSVKSMAENLTKKLFYVTAKTVTASVAVDTVTLFHEKNCHISAVQLVAKEKMCVLDKVACNPIDCPRAKGHFDRINDALYDILMNEELMTREVVKEYAQKHEVCPFEFALDISLFTDMVIGDYNYIFDPRVKLKRYFADGAKGDYVFMVDEAHNLVDRAREMYSAQVVKEEVLACKKRVKELSKRADRALTKLNRIMLEYKRECEGLSVYPEVDDFYMALCNVYEALHSLLEKRITIPEREEIALFYFSVINFMEFYENRNEKYIVYTRQLEDEFLIKIFCADPSSKLQECIDSGRSALFFSATFLPISYYKSLISTKTDNYAVYANSIFDTKNRLLLIGRDVTSKYTKRGTDTYRRVAEYIMHMASGKAGNYMVFFPSYAFMDNVVEAFENLRLQFGFECDTIVQSKNMKESEREEFLQAFSGGIQTEVLEKDSKIDGKSSDDTVENFDDSELADIVEKGVVRTCDTLIGFCVLGGIFSEGIDLTEDSLIGAAIVGTGLGGIDDEQELLKRYFDKAGMNGFDYVYRFPGMNRVAQAAGRVIRTVTDRGVILLLDDRFLQWENKSLFPREWSDARVTTIDGVSEMIEEFWG